LANIIGEIIFSHSAVFKTDNLIDKSELKRNISSFIAVIFTYSSQFRANEIWVRGKLNSHNLVSLQLERSDFFSLYQSKILLPKEFDSEMLLVIDLRLDVFSELSLVEIVVGLFEHHSLIIAKRKKNAMSAWC
jgi:hypothetical protein